MVEKVLLLALSPFHALLLRPTHAPEPARAPRQRSPRFARTPSSARTPARPATTRGFPALRAARRARFARAPATHCIPLQPRLRAASIGVAAARMTCCFTCTNVKSASRAAPCAMSSPLALRSLAALSSDAQLSHLRASTRGAHLQAGCTAAPYASSPPPRLTRGASRRACVLQQQQPHAGTQ